jgi:hypothetical protein
MPRFWILPALGLIAALGFACGDSSDDQPQSSVTATLTATASGSSPSPTSESPTPAPVPSGWDTYSDSQLGFSMPIPQGLSRQGNVVDLPARNDLPATQLRIISFARPDSTPVVGISSTPNPTGLLLDEWIRTRPGWPCDPHGSPTCDPQKVTVSGETGIRFSIDTLGDPAATVYFAHNGVIFSLSGNVFGSGEGGYGPTMTEEEFQTVLQGFRFGQQ